MHVLFASFFLISRTSSVRFSAAFAAALLMATAVKWEGWRVGVGEGTGGVQWCGGARVSGGDLEHVAKNKTKQNDELIVSPNCCCVVLGMHAGCTGVQAMQGRSGSHSVR